MPNTSPTIDSADSAYSRLTVGLSVRKDKINLEVLALQKAKKPDLPEAWVRQVVSVTRSTDSKGGILSGKPQRIDKWVPRKWDESYDAWVAKVFSEALKK